MLLVLQLINRVWDYQMLLLNQEVVNLHHYCPNFLSIFLSLEEGYVETMTLSVSTLMFRENLMKATIHLIKYTPFINFGEKGKDTSRTIVFDVKFVLLLMNGYHVSLFQFWGKNWTEQWVTEVMVYQVRRYVIMWHYYFHSDVIFLTFFI